MSEDLFLFVNSDISENLFAMALYTALRMVRQNKNSLELLSTIFENSSPKGSFGANKKRVEFLLLSPDS